MRRTGKKAAALAVTAALAVSAAGCGSVKDSDVVVTIGGEKSDCRCCQFLRAISRQNMKHTTQE